jgi:Ca2+-binding RTX toxin-like protein
VTDTCAGTDAVADCETCAGAEQQTPPVVRTGIHGTELADQITGTDAAEEILARAGDDTVDAGGGDDVIFGDDGEDIIHAGDGDDAVMGGAHNDTIDAGAGHDLVMGEGGHDMLAGGEGDDLILGGEGDDDLSGGAGNDRLIGEDGTDILRDGEGADVMLGGAGDDWFHLATDVSADLLNGGDGFDTLLLPDDAIQSRTDVAAGTVTIDGNPADTFENIERVVAGDGSDEFDFSGLQRAHLETDAPRFFQITDFGLGDTLRLNNDFTLGLSDLGENSLWSQPDGQSDLQARMQTVSPDSADAGMTRLAFRTGQDENALTRTIEFDVDGDGTTDFTVAVSVLQVEPNDHNFNT